MCTILIIDDDSKIRQTTQLLLEALADWRALAAGSGREGLSLAHKEQPDAILLDVIMPEMDGIATLHHLRADSETQSIPVILFTSVSQEAERRQFAQLPIAGVISKPFEAIELVKQIRCLLNW